MWRQDVAAGGRTLGFARQCRCRHSGGRLGPNYHPRRRSGRRGPAGRRSRRSGSALRRAPLLDAPHPPKKEAPNRTARTVAAPLDTAIPIDFRAEAPAPVANIKGSSPRIKAKALAGPAPRRHRIATRGWRDRARFDPQGALDPSQRAICGRPLTGEGDRAMAGIGAATSAETLASLDEVIAGSGKRKPSRARSRR